MKLLNCPFCNGIAEFMTCIVNKRNSNSIVVRCSTCGAESKKFIYEYRGFLPLTPKVIIKRVDKCKSQSAKLWNKRCNIN